MKFETLIGKAFLENEFYELLLLEIEENFDQYLSKFIHFYFDRIANGKIRIADVSYFNDSSEWHKKGREIVEKREWFGVYENDNHFNLVLCRFDRTGFISSIFRDSTRTEEWSTGWADEKPDRGPMTADEIRQAVRELGGYFEDQKELQKSTSKKAV